VAGTPEIESFGRLRSLLGLPPEQTSAAAAAATSSSGRLQITQEVASVSNWQQISPLVILSSTLSLSQQRAPWTLLLRLRMGYETLHVVDRLSECKLVMQALRMKDVAPLLHDYQRLKPLGLARAAAEQGPVEGGPMPWQAIAEGTDLTAATATSKRNI